ncbi:MAG: nuclear transport factor 2 family protein [Acidobacteria bacterium]|nr:nuclear transport factor 2 family protein [Acidobacteriota bacterium]
MTDDTQAIANLLFGYAERIDRGDFAGVGELFTHGRIVPLPEAPEETHLVGSDAVANLYRSSVRLYEDGTPRTHHVTTNHLIEIAEDRVTASARSYYTVFQKTDDLELTAIITGRYEDTFQLIDKVWWFDQRIMIVGHTGDLSRHLLFDL